MSTKPTKLIGLSVKDFEALVKKGKEIHPHPARLIPFYKPGDEMALTSIFLSSLSLIKEFRDQIYQTISLHKSNHIRYFTEVEFVLFDKKRVDGLIVVFRANKIVDAVILEVKNKNSDLDESQILDYVNIAKEYSIPNLLTISNQFVSFPTQTPLSIKIPKQVKLFHLSWSYIRTIANILLVDNDTNIEDVDQVEIMREVVNYFESPNSGVSGFTQMKPGWVELTQKANAGTTLYLSDSCVEETVSSWLQEERDMALHLSRELGLLVRSGNRKFRNDLTERINNEKKELINKKQLESILQINGAASPLYVRVRFVRKNVEIYSTLSAPLDRKTRGKISWIRSQLRRSEKKNPELFAKLIPNLIVEINIKFAKHPIRLKYDELELAIDKIGSREIKSFNILYLNNLGRKFESRKGVVVIIEEMLTDYYQGFLQFLKRWEKPAPQIVKKVEQEEPYINEP